MESHGAAAHGVSALECRKIALGLLAISVIYLSEETSDSELDRDF